MQTELRREYFEWLCNIVCEMRFSDQVSYQDLLMHLHEITFRYSIPRDQNRAEDGINLRYKFAMLHDCLSIDLILDILDGPCSVLEMMVALAINCEEDIMDDPNVGNRTGQWFWGMIVSLGLGGMTNTNYDSDYVEDVVAIFLDREYEPDGRGGLFTIQNCDRDLTTVEIWYQMCWYLDSIT